MQRVNGPAGPIHHITTNGAHRTHALRILGVPTIAAEVEVASLPLRVDQYTVWGADYTDFTGPPDHLWRALIDRGLLAGDIIETRSGPILEPHHAAAPWLLLKPDDARTVSAAYERVYPGALNIPATAMTSPDAWQRWLLHDR